MLWKTELCPPIENPSDFENQFPTQTQEHDIAVENQDHEETMASDGPENDTAQTSDLLADANCSQQQDGVVNVHRPSSENNTTNTDESDDETTSIQNDAINKDDSARAEVKADDRPSEPKEDFSADKAEQLHVTRRPQRNRQKPLRYRDGVQ
ncbi:hypothetical protein OUZ56_024292 [Daphnia magna]|uniref:Uncharacterized protein n=1 Tax=Daphnia magna TaxID=35525 RepID=A0ABR0B0K1_9CRUS|nr:hypothetical protein OUZ56_024292 [Daphnia magna]